ncbi:MAG: PAS domain-containing protein [Euryarchaeota archaeon]|nr:PAS domain-containing protein [Euryarchaeota archaeon]
MEASIENPAIEKQVKELTEGLRKSEIRLKYLVSSNPAVIYTRKKTGEHSITFISENVAVMMGYEPVKFIEDPGFWVNNIHPDDRPRIFRELPEVFEIGRHSYEYRFKHMDGSYRWIHDELNLIRDTQGSPIELIGYLTDITERKLADEKLISHERFAVAIAELEFDALSGFEVNTLLDAACSLVANSFRIEYCKIMELLPDGKSLIFRAGMGYESDISSVKLFVGTDSMAGYTFMSKQLVILEDIGTEKRFHTQLLEDYGVVSGISVIIGKPENPFGVIEAHSVKSRIFTMDEMQFLETVSNVLGEAIKRRQAERAHIRAKEEAERANSAKTDFLMTMSHELRTPLNAVIGFSQILKQKTFGELNDKQEHYLNNILNGGNNLLKIINQILDAVKLEDGTLKLSMDRMFVHGAVDGVIDIIKEKAAKNNIVIEKELDTELEFIEADMEKFAILLSNLLENAVKFSKPEGGTIKITTKKEGDVASFSVSDTGIGIKEEDMGKLFKKFVQIDSGSSRKYGGTGIGLAVTKQFVELHGGTISAQSKFGDGSTFTFLLPVKAKKHE